MNLPHCDLFIGIDCRSLNFQIRSRIKPQNVPAKKPLPNECSSSSSSSSSASSSSSSSQHLSHQNACTVCASNHSSQHYFSLSCGHSFCKECWAMHFETQINQGTKFNVIQSIWVFTFFSFRFCLKAFQLQLVVWHRNVMYEFLKNWC